MVFLEGCRNLLLFREEFDPGNCAEIFSSGCLWVGIHGFGFRGCSKSVSPFGRVVLGDDVVIFVIYFDNVAVAVIICDDDGVGWVLFGWWVHFLKPQGSFFQGPVNTPVGSTATCPADGSDGDTTFPQ